MVLSGLFRGIPLYTRTTIEPYSVVFLPDRRRHGAPVRTPPLGRSGGNNRQFGAVVSGGDTHRLQSLAARSRRPDRHLSRRKGSSPSRLPSGSPTAVAPQSRDSVGRARARQDTMRRFRRWNRRPTAVRARKRVGNGPHARRYLCRVQQPALVQQRASHVARCGDAAPCRRLARVSGLHVAANGRARRSTFPSHREATRMPRTRGSEATSACNVQRSVFNEKMVRPDLALNIER